MKMIENNMCSQLLLNVIHVLIGCYTTSKIFDVGKTSAFHELVKGDTILRYSANVLAVLHQPTEVIDDLGCQVMMVVLFSGKSTRQRRAFSIVVPSTWNGLPLEIRILPKNNESAFCRLLKTDLYRRGWAGGASE